MLTIVIVAAGIVVLAAGCSSDSGGGDGRLSKRAYIEQADALQSQAAAVFRTLDGKLPATPAKAKPRLTALDELIAGYEQLEPPRAWQDEHDEILLAVRDMRASLALVSKLSARNAKAIRFQAGRYQDAQRRYEAAIDSINATR